MGSESEGSPLIALTLRGYACLNQAPIVSKYPSIVHSYFGNPILLFSINVYGSEFVIVILATNNPLASE